MFTSDPESFDHILDIFNSLHDKLQFTIEKSHDNINFLDVSLIFNKTLCVDWYHKPTSSGRFLNFHSYHPISHKRGIIFGSIDKVFQLSETQFHARNIRWIIDALLKNGYPLDFVFKNINIRIRKYCYTGCESVAGVTAVSFFTLPYIKDISEYFSGGARKFNLRIAHSCTGSLNNLIKKKNPIKNCHTIMSFTRFLVTIAMRHMLDRQNGN